MEHITLGFSEEQFANIVWEMAPISSVELVRIAEERFGWKKSTIYTVLKRLSEKGLFRNENGTVLVTCTREAYEASQTDHIVKNQFHGSLPAFIAAFISTNKLSEEEVRTIRALIDRYGKEETS